MNRRDATTKPVLPGVPVADMAGGLFAAFAVVAALASPDRTGEGEYVDVALTDVAMSLALPLDQIPEPARTNTEEHDGGV